MANKKASELLITERSEIIFASVTGRGVDNYDEDGFIYKVAVALNKEEKKRISKAVLKFWEANKSPETEGKPANWDNIIYEPKEGGYAISATTATEINDEPVLVTLLDSNQNLLDPTVYGSMGKGSEGCLGINMKVYTSGKKEGVSLWLSALQILSYVPYSGGGGGAKVAGQFAKTDDEALGSSSEFAKGDKKKKKKKSKEAPEAEAEEAPKKKKKKKEEK